MQEVVRESLRCKLTDEEIMVYARSLAQATKDLEDVELRKKQIVDDFKAQASRHEADISIYGSRVRDGHEYREVECRWELIEADPIPSEKRLVRQDTFDIVRTVRLSAEEVAELQQGRLPL